MPDSSNQSLPLPLPKPVSDDTASSADADKNSTAALQIVRGKVSAIFDDTNEAKEPSALKEEQEILATGPHSRHQEYIKSLMESGKSLAAIQTEWHAYYQKLPDSEKHQVWNEFYANYNQATHPKPAQTTALATEAPAAKPETKPTVVKSDVKPKPALLPTITAPVLGSVQPMQPERRKETPKKSVADTKTELLNKVTARGKLKPKHHLQSLLFGLSMGFITVAFVMFGFFNERFIAPFITPSRTASASPIIIDPNEKVGPESKVIIPKINVDVPVVYDITTTEEKVLQDNLENGVIHYPGTPTPGQNGNIVVVGHSSNNLLNKGKYKFAFVLLSKLQEGDTITMQYGGKRYVYKVYEKKIIKPTDVSVLGPTEKQASLTLITCDPPGTSKNRLVIHAEQISPAVSGNSVASSAPETTNVATTPAIVPGNAQSLFDRLFGWL